MERLSEKQIEAALVKAVKNEGGLCPKFVSPGLNGVPDRIVLLPDSRMAFVELKAPGKTLRPLQQFRKRQLENLGYHVYVVDSIDLIHTTLSRIKGGDES